MPTTVRTAATIGIDAYPVHVEVDTDRQLPSFTVVGLPDSAVRESKERVMAAVRNAGFNWPRRRVTVNLAPAAVRKAGSAFDLAIAVGVLAASGQIRGERLADFVLLGELSLSGSVRPLRGLLPIAVSLRDQGDYGMIVPRDNAREAALADGPVVYGIATLSEAVELVEGGVIGASLFVLLMITIGRYALRASRFSHKPLVQGLGIGFLCGLIGLCGQMFFTELLVLPKISVPFLLLAAAVSRLGDLEDQSSHLKQRSVAQ